MKPLISFLIVNYKTEDLTLDLISSIQKYLKKYNYEILVYDNSPNLSNKLSHLSDVNTKVFFNGTNIGFVKANNFLLHHARGDLIFLINNDVILIDNSFENMIEFLLGNDDIGIIGPMLLNVDRTYQVSFYKFPTIVSLIKEMILLQKRDPYVYNTDINQIQFCEVIKGACLGFRRNSLPQDYLFDENFEMYSEEVDLCFRFYKSGLKNVYYPDCKVIHYGGASSNFDEDTLKYSTYHYFRSKLLFFRKHYRCIEYFFAKVIIILSLIERMFIFLTIAKIKKFKIFWYTFSQLLIKTK